MISKLTARDVYKVFGPSPQKVKPLLEAGRGKDEIFAETGHTVGARRGPGLFTRVGRLLTQRPANAG